jgi:hypothetical protein
VRIFAENDCVSINGIIDQPTPRRAFCEQCSRASQVSP